jgi:hypothetical protein
LQGGGGSDSDHYTDDDDDDVDGEDDDTNDDNNGDVRCKAFTFAAEGIKAPQVASCGSLEQSPLF